MADPSHSSDWIEESKFPKKAAMASTSSRAADDGVHLFAETSLAQPASSSAASFQQQHHQQHLLQAAAPPPHDYRFLDHSVNFDPVAGSSSSFYQYGAMNPATASSSTAEEQQEANSGAVAMEGSEQYYYGKYFKHKLALLLWRNCIYIFCFTGYQGDEAGDSGNEEGYYANSPYRVQRFAANIRERKRMLR